MNIRDWKLPGWAHNIEFAKTSRPVFAAALILTLLAVLVTWRDPQIVTTGYSETAWGPIGASDRDALYKVKQAGLWEMPVGHELAVKSTSPDIRAMGARISVEHMQLDAMTHRVAKQLGVELPDEASPDQKRWVSELSAMKPGAEYDRLAVFYLRRAHGNVLPLLAQVKAGTRNELVRDFTTEGMTFVSRHIGYLDESGLVDYSQLPEPPTPSPYQQPSVASRWDSLDARTLFAGGIVILVLGALLASIVVPMVKARPGVKPPKTAAATPPRGGKRRRR